MSDSPEVAAAKRDGNYLREVLKIDRDGQHCKCPICGDKTMRVGADKEGSGVFLWQCMKGCGKGTVVDALIKVENKTQKDALSEIWKRFRNNNPEKVQRDRPEAESTQKNSSLYKEYPEPKIDLEAADKFVNYAHQTLLDSEELQQKWLGKRHISLDVAKIYRLGFLSDFKIRCLGKNGRNDWDWRVTNGWILPITNENGALMAVKVHFEEKQGTFEGKSTWMPFGTEPNHDRVKNIMPRHAYYGLWPHPLLQMKDKRALPPEFQTQRDAGWWLHRVTDRDLIDKINCLEREERIAMAYDMGVGEDDLQPFDLVQCRERVFEKLRRDIQQHVLAAIKGSTSAANGNGAKPRQQDFIVFTPGELKALAVISTGMIATSSTGGEGSLPPVHAFRCFKGQRVIILRDDDEPKKPEKSEYVLCAGRKFVHLLYERLRPNQPREIRSFTHGRQ